MNSIKNQKGITLIALVITVIVMFILVGFAYSFSKDAVNRTMLEDIKTNMLLIEAKAKTIYEKYSFSEIDELTGLEIDPEGYETFGFVISEELRNDINKNPGQFYIWEQEDLNNNGLGTIKIDIESFYIIDYETNEIFYSKGYTKDGVTYYRLTEIEAL